MIVRKMWNWIKENYHHLPGCSSGLCEQLTSLTNGIRFKANAVSRTMDTMHGGVLKYGRFHRLYGGHSAADSGMWARFGTRYGKELAKDSLTNNGLPIPGIETAVRSGVLKASTAQKWCCLNVGDIFAAGVSAVDTALNVRQFIRNEDRFREHSSKIAFKGVTKITVASIHGNVPLMVLGATDVGMAAWSKLSSSIEIEFELSPFVP